MIRAVLDANVFISAAIKPHGTPGQILKGFLDTRVFALVLTPTIVEEVLRVVAYPKIAQRIDAKKVRDWLDDIALYADMIPGEIVVTGVCHDPDDDKYLAAAIEGLAAYVVSGERHLLAVGEYEGVRVVEPQRLLELIAAS